MDYNTEKVLKVINLYLMLLYHDASYIRNEVGKFIKNYLLPELHNDEEEADDEEETDDEEEADDEDDESIDISDLTRRLINDCQSVIDKAVNLSRKKNRIDIILKEISSTANDISNYNDKPLLSQLVCLWYIISSGQNEYQQKVIDSLKEQWKIKDDILAELIDTFIALNELKENSQKAITCVPQKGFLFKIKNFFRKSKLSDYKLLFEEEYKKDEKALRNSLKELFATESV